MCFQRFSKWAIRLFFRTPRATTLFHVLILIHACQCYYQIEPIALTFFRIPPGFVNNPIIKFWQMSLTAFFDTLLHGRSYLPSVRSCAPEKRCFTFETCEAGTVAEKPCFDG